MSEWDGHESSCACDCGFDIPKGGHLETLTLGDITGIANLIYPVGSIYITLNDTSPALLFGGTWEKIEDRFLLASGSNSAGETGGAESYNLSVESHTHTIDTQDNVKFVSSAVTSGDYDIPITGTTKGAGSVNETIPTMPPYLVVHVWQRVEDPVSEEQGNFYENTGKLMLDANGEGIVEKSNSGSYTSKFTGVEIDAGIDAANAALPKTGGTMQGDLILNGDPTSRDMAASKGYVDSEVTLAIDRMYNHANRQAQSALNDAREYADDAVAGHIYNVIRLEDNLTGKIYGISVIDGKLVMYEYDFSSEVEEVTVE